MLDEKFQTELLELMAYYHNRACPCAFPRFRALISLDLPAIILEKEALIQLARPNYTLQAFTERTDKHEHWTCKVCGSTFYASFQSLQLLPGRWEDCLVVTRHQLYCSDIGDAPGTLVPLCLATLPPYEAANKFTLVSKPAFVNYMKKIK